jgi:hypothetical protein
MKVGDGVKFAPRRQDLVGVARVILHTMRRARRGWLLALACVAIAACASLDGCVSEPYGSVDTGSPPDADATDSAPTTETGPPQDAGPDTSDLVVSFGAYRAWGDGTYASSCAGYLNPTSGAHRYAGATGDGVYAVTPGDAGSPTNVLCDMTRSDGGWTLIMASSPSDRGTPAGATAQTAGCTTPTAYCSVASKPWSYDALRATWTGCPSAEAQVSRTAYQDDTGACSNTEDSLVISWGAEGSLGNGMKVWNDCGLAPLRLHPRGLSAHSLSVPRSTSRSSAPSSRGLPSSAEARPLQLRRRGR